MSVILRISRFDRFVIVGDFDGQSGTQGYVFQTLEKFSDQKIHFASTKFITKNSVFDKINFCKQKDFNFPKSEKHIELVCTKNNRQSVERVKRITFRGQNGRFANVMVSLSCQTLLVRHAIFSFVMVNMTEFLRHVTRGFVGR